MDGDAVWKWRVSFLLALALLPLAAAAQDGFDPCDHFTAAKGLREVVVGAHLQADDTVDLVTLCGQHDDRDVRLGAEPPAER